MDDAKKAILKDIFWQMNEISSHTESKTESSPKPTTATGTSWKPPRQSHAPTFILQSVTRPPRKWQTVSASTPTSGSGSRNCLPKKTVSCGHPFLYGIYSGDDTIVTVALSQVGNIGGEPYWSWYGFGSRVEWCACFVSFGAPTSAAISTRVSARNLPVAEMACSGFRSVDNGWMAPPSLFPGMIIFFDWDNKGGSGPQDGEADHVGIVLRRWRTESSTPSRAIPKSLQGEPLFCGTV